MDWKAVKKQFKETWITTCLSLILFAGATQFILYIENNFIQGNMLLEELISSSVSFDVHIGGEAEAAQFEGRVVHVIGPLRILEPISEPDYNIQVQAVKLKKRVQMYQWIEEVSDQRHFLSDTSDESEKTYWYTQEWRDDVVDSSLFYIRPGHENPPSIPLASEIHIAEYVKIGWVSLGVEVKRKINDYYEIWSDSRPERSDIKLHSGFYYHGDSALEHQTGDLRVHFSYAGRQDDIYTVIGAMENGVIVPFESKRFPSLDPIALLQKGSFTVKRLHELQRRGTVLSTWMYRFFGFIQVFTTALTLHPQWIVLLISSPLVGPALRRSAKNWVIFIFSLSYTLFVISLPWLYHKPVFGVILAASAAAPLLHYANIHNRNRLA